MDRRGEGGFLDDEVLFEKYTTGWGGSFFPEIVWGLIDGWNVVFWMGGWLADWVSKLTDEQKANGLLYVVLYHEKKGRKRWIVNKEKSWTAVGLELELGLNESLPLRLIEGRRGGEQERYSRKEGSGRYRT